MTADGNDYPKCTKKVVPSDYIAYPENETKTLQKKEEYDMINTLDGSIQSGAAFKDSYGHFNYKLCYNDGLLKLARNDKGELIQPEVRTQNDVMSPDKTTIIGQFNDKD